MKVGKHRLYDPNNNWILFHHMYICRLLPITAGREIVDVDWSSLHCGYAHEEHIVLIKDTYLMTLHSIPKRLDDGTVPSLRGRREVWACLTDEARCLPFMPTK